MEREERRGEGKGWPGTVVLPLLFNSVRIVIIKKTIRVIITDVNMFLMITAT